MKLKTAHVRNYRSIRDSGEFEIEDTKTILVGPNEAGKSALLRAIQQINAPPEVGGFTPIRDYPRALFNDITSGKVKPAETPVVTAIFALLPEDVALIDQELAICSFRVTRYLDNHSTHNLVGAPQVRTFADIQSELKTLAVHVDARSAAPTDSPAYVESERIARESAGSFDCREPPYVRRVCADPTLAELRPRHGRSGRRCPDEGGLSRCPRLVYM